LRVHGLGRGARVRAMKGSGRTGDLVVLLVGVNVEVMVEVLEAEHGLLRRDRLHRELPPQQKIQGKRECKEAGACHVTALTALGLPLFIYPS
jgi:hypothetical protein